MSEAPLLALAAAAGVAHRWQDVYRIWHDVTPDTLRAVLAALGLPAWTDTDVAASLHVAQHPAGLAPLVTAALNTPIRLPIPDSPVQVVLEDGTIHDLHVTDGMLPGIGQVGYHRLRTAVAETVLAVAPARCWSVEDVHPQHRPWALAVQLYSLRRAGDGGLGDFAGLQNFVAAAGAHGAAGVAISPVHAQFSADPDRFSPYSPSSRLMLNVLHASLDVPDAAREAAELVDWPGAGRARLAALRAQFAAATPDVHARLARFRTERGDVLETHARFEALHAHLFGTDPGRWHWRTWPDQYRRPDAPAVAGFAAENAGEVALHAYMQMAADDGLADAQASARAAGMPIGLIADTPRRCWA